MPTDDENRDGIAKVSDEVKAALEVFHAECLRIRAGVSTLHLAAFIRAACSLEGAIVARMIDHRCNVCGTMSGEIHDRACPRNTQPKRD